MPRRRLVVALALALGVLVLAAIWVGVRTKQAADALARARDGAADIRTAVTAGDPATARERLAGVQADAARARQATSDPVYALAAAIPYLGRTPAAVREISATGDLLAQDVLGPLVDAAEELAPERLRVEARQVNVDALAEALPPVEEAAAGVQRAKERMQGVEVAGTPGQVQDAVANVGDELDELEGQLEPLARGLRLLPPMLGADGPRRYLLAMQSNNEARGTGGFLGSWGVLRFDDGAVTIEKLAPRRFLDNQVYDTLPLDFGADYAAFYGDQPGSWASANLSPHFPYAARLWLKFWQDREGERLDGVLTTDPVATSYLLDAVGGFQLPDGQVIDGHNFVRLTESTVYQRFDDDLERDTYLQQIGRAVLNRVLRFLGNPQRVVEALGKAAGERRVLVYSTRPAEEQALAQMAVGGTLPEGPGPVAGLAINNGAGNKADYYLGQELDYRLLSCDAATDTQRTQITVTLHNGIPVDNHLPQYVIGRVDLATPADPEPSRGGEHRVYAQIYAAVGAQLLAATLDGEPVGVQAGSERGRPVFRLPVTIAPESAATVTLDLLEPLAGGTPRTWTTPLVKKAVVTADPFSCGG